MDGTNPELIENDYDGISKVLNSFVELYKVCENKELIDEALKSFTSANLIFNVFQPNTYK